MIEWHCNKTLTQRHSTRSPELFYDYVLWLWFFLQKISPPSLKLQLCSFCQKKVVLYICHHLTRRFYFDWNTERGECGTRLSMTPGFFCKLRLQKKIRLKFEGRTAISVGQALCIIASTRNLIWNDNFSALKLHHITAMEDSRAWHSFLTLLREETYLFQCFSQKDTDDDAEKPPSFKQQSPVHKLVLSKLQSPAKKYKKYASGGRKML